MLKSFMDLKQDSRKFLEALLGQLAKVITPVHKDDDDRFWRPEVGEDGNGYALIRFLDSPKGEDVPLVRLWEHRFNLAEYRFEEIDTLHWSEGCGQEPIERSLPHLAPQRRRRRPSENLTIEDRLTSGSHPQKGGGSE